MGNFSQTMIHKHSQGKVVLNSRGNIVWIPYGHNTSIVLSNAGIETISNDCSIYVLDQGTNVLSAHLGEFHGQKCLLVHKSKGHKVVIPAKISKCFIQSDDDPKIIYIAECDLRLPIRGADMREEYGNTEAKGTELVNLGNLPETIYASGSSHVYRLEGEEQELLVAKDSLFYPEIRYGKFVFGQRLECSHSLKPNLTLIRYGETKQLLKLYRELLIIPYNKSYMMMGGLDTIESVIISAYDFATDEKLSIYLTVSNCSKHDNEIYSATLSANSFYSSEVVLNTLLQLKVLMYRTKPMRIYSFLQDGNCTMFSFFKLSMLCEVVVFLRTVKYKYVKQEDLYLWEHNNEALPPVLYVWQPEKESKGFIVQLPRAKTENILETELTLLWMADEHD